MILHDWLVYCAICIDNQVIDSEQIVHFSFNRLIEFEVKSISRPRFVFAVKSLHTWLH